MNAQERLEYLLETEFVPTNATITVASIVAAVGLDAGRLVVGTINVAATQDPILAASSQALATVGMSLSSPDRQSLVDQLAVAGSWPDSVRDAVKALGGVDRPRWQGLGYQAEPTLQSVTLELTKQQLEDAAVDALQAFREALAAWDGSGDPPLLGGA